MKVLIIHNDLRVYWRRRLFFLRDFLKCNNIELNAVELFGKGSPYNFESFNKTESWWDCLFPNQSNFDLTKHQIKDKVFNKLDEIRPDVVIGGSIVFYSGALGLQWAKRNKKKFIMFDDAKPSWVKRNFIVQAVKDLITNQIDALWLPSDEYDQEYTRLYSKSKIKYLYGYDCIDNNLFKVEGEKRVDNKKIITVSRLVEKKNVKSLLDVWKYVENNDDSYSLIVVGDGPLFGELQDHKKNLGLKRVSFLGVTANDQLPGILHEADAFVSPSLYESWGLVVNEAMAAGLPVLLSTKINAAFTLVKEGENGYMFDPGEQEIFQEKLLKFIKLPVSVKKEMSLKSLELISRMDFNYMGDELLQTLSFLQTRPFKKPSLFARLVLNRWYGRYNTKEWDKV
ncbi:glycosyltransferase family 4 protein [Mucilaginibacter sp. L3T2-6]|uniref:glycosyltransferase family 4 protein n=1 Tax=Mucilaginibacter sp. L3T2-6 TaxID=3062491 RepID=UPI002676FFBF|nr:glycosyltransferase [Mucilaginibacter sp. L3T2-6]MDO3643709.1 glycosyltransferase [Mucilaginibacter sp. L3T2-6]MDV6216043.1 glycosyltransferase [Mucilaginibacter sp. L3T2-6]